MLLTPKRRKHIKQMIPSLKGKITRWTTIAIWEYGLKAITNGYVSNKEIEVARKVVVRHTKKLEDYKIRVFPDIPFYEKMIRNAHG